MAQKEPDIAGFYITDDYVDVVFGSDPDEARKADANICVTIGDGESDTFRHMITKGDTPADVIVKVVRELRRTTSRVRSVCIGVYGPLVPQLEGEHAYREVQAITPHRLMRGINVRQKFEDAFVEAFGRAPETFFVETDVACAALGEVFQRYTHDGVWIKDGARKVLAFLKVSHGIGGATCRATNPDHGQFHSEMGQIMVRKWRAPWRDPANDEERFEGIGLYPGRIESLASIGAIEERFGVPYAALFAQPEHPAWHRQAWYLAQMCLAVTAVAAPSKIVMGGRVMDVPHLLEKVRFQFRQMLGGVPYPRYDQAMEPDYIDRDLRPDTGEPSKPGAVGAFVYAAVCSRRVEPQIRTGGRKPQ